MDPLDLKMKQRLTLQYLTPMGEYQELIPHVYEHKALDLIFFYIDLKQSRDARLSFEAARVRVHIEKHASYLHRFSSKRSVLFSTFRLCCVTRSSLLSSFSAAECSGC